MRLYDGWNKKSNLMPEKFRNIYVIKTVRLPGYDYSQNGMYFVTVCTKDKENFFGEIKNGEIILSDIGKIADQFWQEIPKHFPHVNLDEYVVMPNHLHGNLEINWDNVNNTQQCVETQNFASLRADGQYKNKFGPQSKNLSSIIRGFKIGVKKYATMNSIDFQWQSRFYDRVIRDDDELNRIREYIFSNPQNWERDRNSDENLWI
jgi:putative transposase